MKIEQLKLDFFDKKTMFDSTRFEKQENLHNFSGISNAILNAFDKFKNADQPEFDNTTRANMLNNLVVSEVRLKCESDNFKFYSNLSNTRRSFAILDEKYLFLFKKSPISNIKTQQDELLKNQELSKHVIYVSYTVDDFWSVISKVELVYQFQNTVSYSRDITNFAESGYLVNINSPKQEKPIVKVKEELKDKRKAN